MAQKDVAIDFVAGSLGATTSVYVGQPMDTLKVKMQTFPHLYPNLGLCFKWVFPWAIIDRGPYYNPGIFFRETLAKEGIVRGLYAGTVPSLAANVAENSILFAAYGVCQKMVANATNTEVSKLSTLANGTSGEFWVETGSYL